MIKSRRARQGLEERLLREYDMCFERWLSMNTQVWQVPALAITAQAFLFTIMFSSTTGHWPRVASAVLAMAAAFLSIHVITKHRYHQSQDFGRMLEIEKLLELSPFAYPDRAADPRWKKNVDSMLPGKHRLQVRKLPLSSVTVWVAGLIFFMLVALGVCVAAFVEPEMFSQSPPAPTPSVVP